MPEYTVQRLRGGFACVWHLYDEHGQPILDARGKPKRHRKRLIATDKPGADAEARQRWAGRGDEPWTVGRIVPAYIASREEAEIASTPRQKDAWKAMEPFWGRIDPAMIDDRMAKDYAAQRDRAPATVRYELSMLSVALRWAKEAKHISEAKELWRPAAEDRKVRHLTRQMFGRWLDQVKAPHARLYVKLAIYTMARPAAILEARWGQVDWDHSTLDLNPKGRKQTKKRRPVVPLHSQAIKALQEAYEARQSDFIVERGGKRIACIKKAFQAASERSGIKVTPYMLRHTAAVWAANGGAPMAKIAQYMGHDDDVTTQKHYARFSPDYLRDVSSNLLLEENDA